VIAHTKEEFLGWKALWGVEITPEGLAFLREGVEEQHIAVNIRVDEPHQIVFLARLLAQLRGTDDRFDGAVLWITARGIWDKYVESVCTAGIELQRRGFGELRSLHVAPVHYFEAHEFHESLSMLVWPMLAGWDAFYYPKGGRFCDYYLSLSHDGFIDVVSANTAFLGEVAATLKELKWIE